MSRRVKRNEPVYTVFRSGQRLSAFHYPKEQAERVFADLLNANPLNQLLPVEKPGKGDAVRETVMTRHPSPRKVENVRKS